MSQRQVARIANSRGVLGMKLRCDGSHRDQSLALGLQVISMHTGVALHELAVCAGLKSCRCCASVMLVVINLRSSQ